jgi:hypothetical protein
MSAKWLMPCLLLLAVSACSGSEFASSPTETVSGESCPRSTPNVKVSPHEHFISIETGYQNRDGTLFTDLPEDGKLLLDPQSVEKNGSLGPIKWWWYLQDVFGELSVEGRRLDGAAPPLEAEFVNSSRTEQGPTGPQQIRMLFPSTGCWEITASTDDASIRLVLSVAVGEDS